MFYDIMVLYPFIIIKLKLYGGDFFMRNNNLKVLVVIILVLLLSVIKNKVIEAFEKENYKEAVE